MTEHIPECARDHLIGEHVCPRRCHECGGTAHYIGSSSTMILFKCEICGWIISAPDVSVALAAHTAPALDKLTGNTP